MPSRTKKKTSGGMSPNDVLEELIHDLTVAEFQREDVIESANVELNSALAALRVNYNTLLQSVGMELNKLDKEFVQELEARIEDLSLSLLSEMHGGLAVCSLLRPIS